MLQCVGRRDSPSVNKRGANAEKAMTMSSYMQLTTSKGPSSSPTVQDAESQSGSWKAVIIGII